MMKLKLQLLGEPRIFISETSEVYLATKKSQALVVYLASSPGIAHSRDHLATLLWGRSAKEQARSSLRQNLSKLRNSLGPCKDAIDATAQQIRFDTDFVEIDYIQFEKLMSGGTVEELEEATGMLRGEFAAGLYINEADFDDWLSNERRRLSDIAISGLVQLLDHYTSNNQSSEAIVIARKLLALDPLQERVHLSLMTALADQERYESALQQYKICCDHLRKELDISPGKQAIELRNSIARDRASFRHTPTAPEVESSGLITALTKGETPDYSTNKAFFPQLEGLNLSTPMRPSLLILPFQNISGDPANDYLAEGIRIDIQAALVKITGIFLIAAGSANAMRGKDAIEAGSALSVQYVLQGSIRKSGSKLRVSTELIDTKVGNAIWTENYNRQWQNGFDVQDEIIREIITALDVRLLHGEQAAVWHRTLKDIDSLEFFYRGVDEFFKQNKDSNLRARRFFELVDKKQPNVSTGATWIAMCHWLDAFKAWGKNLDQSLRLAGEWAERAVIKEDADGQAHMVLSHVHLLNKRFDEALIIGREAVTLRPNCTNANGFFANVLHFCGEQSDAIQHVTWAIRYSPVYPPFFADILALALLFSDRFTDAIAVAAESLRLNPEGITPRLVQIAAYSAQNKLSEANKIGEQLISVDKMFSLTRFAKQQPYRNPNDLTGFIDKLSAVKLPD